MTFGPTKSGCGSKCPFPAFLRAKPDRPGHPPPIPPLRNHGQADLTMPPCRRFDTGLGHDRKIALPFDVCSLAVGRAAAQAKALELFAAVGAVDMEAISALLHRLAVSPSVDDLFADRLIAGVVPILTTHAAKAAVQVPTS